MAHASAFDRLEALVLEATRIIQASRGVSPEFGIDVDRAAELAARARAELRSVDMRHVATDRLAPVLSDLQRVESWVAERARQHRDDGDDGGDGDQKRRRRAGKGPGVGSGSGAGDDSGAGGGSGAGNGSAAEATKRQVRALCASTSRDPRSVWANLQVVLCALQAAGADIHPPPGERWTKASLCRALGRHLRIGGEDLYVAASIPEEVLSNQDEWPSEFFDPTSLSVITEPWAVRRRHGTDYYFQGTQSARDYVRSKGTTLHSREPVIAGTMRPAPEFRRRIQEHALSAYGMPIPPPQDEVERERELPYVHHSQFEPYATDDDGEPIVTPQEIAAWQRLHADVARRIARTDAELSAIWELAEPRSASEQSEQLALKGEWRRIADMWLLHLPSPQSLSEVAQIPYYELWNTLERVMEASSVAHDACAFSAADPVHEACAIVFGALADDLYGMIEEYRHPGSA